MGVSALSRQLNRSERPMLRGLKICALLLATLPAAATSAFAADKVYVTNQDSDTVSVIDVDTLAVIATIPVGDVPHNVNHTPDGRRVLVTNKNVNVDAPPSLSLIDPETDKVVVTVEGIGRRIEHVVSTRPDLAYVSEDLGRNAIAVVDLQKRRVTDFIPVGVKPHGLWPTPAGDALFAPNQLSGTLSKIDLATNRVVAEAVVGRTPTMAAVTPDGKTVFVTLFGERGVAVVNAELVETERMQINDVIPVGERPAQVAITPDGRYVLVPCEGPGALYVIDAQTHDIVATIPTGAKAHGVDVSGDGKLAFVSNWGDGTLSVVDLAALRILEQIEVGAAPAGVDFVDRAEPGSF